MQGRAKASTSAAVAARVHRIYEDRPYPAVPKRGTKPAIWRLPPWEWIEAIWQPADPVPERILVAGCGTGLEAFAVSGHFPSAEVVAVDFSARSIAVARDLQKRDRKLRQIRFVRADLASTHFAKVGRGEFDFISCHGVLSYIPQVERVLRNFVRSLTPRGVLYLGVNGVAHFSVKWRAALPRFGFDVACFDDGRRLRQVLAFFDRVTQSPGGPLARKDAAYLASDLFAPLIRNLPLAQWIKLCRAAGLAFLSSYSGERTLRFAINDEACRHLLPRSRAEVCELVETLRPSAFHGLLFSREPAGNPPWENRRELLRWRVIRTPVYGNSWPARRGDWQALRTVRLQSESTNSLIELRVPEWEIEIVRQSNGKRSLAEIVNRIPVAISSASLCSSLYLLYQLALINVLSPVCRERLA
ncbi:MAG: class I SAM-dependent methyltransferase [Verrucomicrobiota bacterium]|nr:class I SAM-dependent methyltransferase [Verrucomicrobiota bacterium]